MTLKFEKQPDNHLKQEIKSIASSVYDSLTHVQEQDQLRLQRQQLTQACETMRDSLYYSIPVVEESLSSDDDEEPSAWKQCLKLQCDKLYSKLDALNEALNGVASRRSSDQTPAYNELLNCAGDTLLPVGEFLDYLEQAAEEEGKESADRDKHEALVDALGKKMVVQRKYG